tara:strand:+ start:368 stop:706 length:339 start_codon:yes stop_codon:yes gene_type:complete
MIYCRSLAEPYRTVTVAPTPYRPSAVSAQKAFAEAPRWKRALGSLLRIFGAIVIAIPIVVVVIDIHEITIQSILADLPGILTALACYFGFGSLLIVLGNRLTGQKDGPESTG